MKKSVLTELIKESTTRQFIGVDPVDGPIYHMHFSHEKFTELILSQCLSIIRTRKDLAIDYEWNVDEAMTTSMLDIEDYFGVEL